VLIRLTVCGLMATARLLELAWSRRNIARDGRHVEGAWSRRTYPAIVALHAAVIGGTALLGRPRVRAPWLVALILVQPVRAWVLLTLGGRWNVRGAVPAEMTVATSGPYAYVRHPNYSVVAVELASLPAAFGLYALSLGATIVNAVLIAVRVRDEERLLFGLPGYREHFGSRPRFLPLPLPLKQRRPDRTPAARALDAG
jgi:methyltransferase